MGLNVASWGFQVCSHVRFLTLNVVYVSEGQRACFLLLVIAKCTSITCVAGAMCVCVSICCC